MFGNFLAKLGRVFLYQAARGSRGMASTVGRLAATGAKGTLYKSAGVVGRATGQIVKTTGKTVTSPFLPK